MKCESPTPPPRSETPLGLSVRWHTLVGTCVSIQWDQIISPCYNPLIPLDMGEHRCVILPRLYTQFPALSLLWLPVFHSTGVSALATLDGQ